MNFKAAHRYQLMEYKKSVMIYYLVLALVFLFFGVMISVGEDSGFVSTGGIEISSVIFLFVVGLNSFKETFLMLMQNGISRKTMFLSRIAAMGVLCTVMMVIDRFVVGIITPLANNSTSFRISGMYEQMFYNRAKDLNFVQKNLEGVIFTLCFYIASMAVGYFITTAYYRMNKAVKLAVSVGVPVGLFFVLPIVDATIAKGKFSEFLNFLAGDVFGMNKELPFRFTISCIVSACIFFGLSWLLIRKAVDKK